MLARRQRSQGNLGVIDFQKYRNLQADTAMRQSIAGPPDGASATES